jgi:uncharacterized membrane protein
VEPKAKAAALVSGGTGGAERALLGAAGGTQEEKYRWHDSTGGKSVYPHTKPGDQNGNPGLYLTHHGSSSPNYRVFHAEPADLRSLSGIVTDALSLQSRGIMQLGLLLIATPVARVAFSVFAFAQQRDRTYVIVTLSVLAVLLYSLVGGYL